jgi:Uma2 family endonuclease
MAVAHTGLTLEEFLRLPEEKPALEYLDGVVSQKMAPSGPHSRLQAELAFRFMTYLHLNPIAQVYTELRVRWHGEASLVPDLSVYRSGRIPTSADGQMADEFWVPPDIAIEIASPDQSVPEMTRRANTLLARGVPVVMVVEPRQVQVRVARLGHPITTYRHDDVVAFEDVLPGFSFAVRDLFATLQVRRPGQGDG